MIDKSDSDIEENEHGSPSKAQFYVERCEELLKRHKRNILEDPSDQWTVDEIIDHYSLKLFAHGLNGQDIPISVLSAERNHLIKKYGNKIYDNPSSEWTNGEIAAHKLYKVYSDLLHDLVPDLKKLDSQYEFFDKNGINSLAGWIRYFSKYVKKVFWIIFLIVVFLAVVKYLLQ